MGESMEIESPDTNKCSTPGIKENLHLYPVSANDSGEGLPYAPEDWPRPGDKWRWKVGRRIAASGYFCDRYLYPPSRLVAGSSRKKDGLASKLSVEQYIRSTFPDADVNGFFASFSWKIPSKQLHDKIGDKIGFIPSRTTAHSGSDSQLETSGCKAGNRGCISLVEERNTPSELMSCDICCIEQGFCRHCCCILCCRTTSSAYGGYTYIRCEAIVDEGCICGHIAHIDCGLRTYMAGTVGGSISLDAEYYCRRCDARTDLVPHVKKLLERCKTIDFRDVIEKILNVGICLLRGSRRASAQQLLHDIELSMAKLKEGTNLEEVWRKESNSSGTAGGSSDKDCTALRSRTDGQPPNSTNVTPRSLSSKFDHRVESLKLENEIDEILLALRKSQEYEYNLAEEMLLAQKNYIQNLYEQLEKERSDLFRHASGGDSEALLDAVLERVEQIKGEVIKLKDMKTVAKGFGKTSKHILKNHFGLETE